LKVSFLLLCTTRPLLDPIAAKSQDMTDRQELENASRLILNRQDRLVSHFPQLIPVAKEWEKRGGL
jgi:hypothetical protein